MKHALALLLSCLAVHVALSDETNLTLTVDRFTYSDFTLGTVTPVIVTNVLKGILVSQPPPELQKLFETDPKKVEAAQRAMAEQKRQEAERKRMTTEEWRRKALQQLQNSGTNAGPRRDSP